MHEHVCVCICYLMLLLTCFLAIITICLNTFFPLSVCLTLNYHTFNLNSVYLHVTLMVSFKANFLLSTIKYYVILSYFTYFTVTLEPSDEGPFCYEVLLRTK